MELQSEGGALTIPIHPNSTTEIGRNPQPPLNNPTISRRHLSLHPTDNNRVGFEVIGRNPILVCSGNNKSVYKRFEKGELELGDKVSLSIMEPCFLVVKRSGEIEKSVVEAVERREKRSEQRRKEKEGGDEDELIGELGFDVGSLHVDRIDPVKEFGFLVKGHEFEQYGRQRIPAIKNWNWFLEESGKKNDDDDDDETIDIDKETSSKGKKSRRRKRGGEEDDDWTGESEEEKVSAVKVGSGKRPKYSTRSKDSKKSCKNALGGRKPTFRKDENADEGEVEVEDEEDETLGGFIVDNVDEAAAVEEEESEEEMEEEEEVDEEESEEELEEEEEVDEEEYDDD